VPPHRTMAGNLSESGWNESLSAPSANDTDFQQQHPNNNNVTFMYDEGSGDELYEVPISIVILLSLLYGAISVAALIGNFLVLWVVSVSLFMCITSESFSAFNQWSFLLVSSIFLLTSFSLVCDLRLFSETFMRYISIYISIYTFTLSETC